MRVLICIITFFSLCTAAVATRFGDPQVDRLYQSIYDAGFSDEKKELGNILGALETAPAKEALLVLLEDKSYWNRTAAVAGLCHFKDPETSILLVNTCLSDHMIHRFLRDKIRNDWQTYFPAMKQKWQADLKDRSRKDLLELISMGRNVSARNFLMSIVADKASGNRKMALDQLTHLEGAINDTFIREQLSDPELKDQVLSYLLRHGSNSDLPIFTAILENREKQYQTKAFQAINLWGTPQHKENVFFQALVSGSMSDCTSLVVFEQVTSPRLMEQLLIIGETSSYQRMRMLACLQLLNYDDTRITLCLEKFMQEPFDYDQIGGLDIFMAHATVLTSVALKHFSERHREKNFHQAKEKIRRKLDGMKG